MSDNPPQNPFQAPNPSDSPSPNFSTRQPQHGQPGRGYVNQIPILAIMTIVQGVLLLMMGVGCIGYGFLIGNMPEMMPPEDRARLQAETAGTFEVISVVAFVMGAIILVISIMHFIAGIRNLRYQGRIFTVVTWLLGLLASFTCYCGPTSVGLAIWGMIVFLNPAVASAFKMAEEGMDRKEIPNQFF